MSNPRAPEIMSFFTKIKKGRPQDRMPNITLICECLEQNASTDKLIDILSIYKIYLEERLESSLSMIRNFDYLIDEIESLLTIYSTSGVLQNRKLSYKDIIIMGKAIGYEQKETKTNKAIAIVK
jgi:hypothetical protein